MFKSNFEIKESKKKLYLVPLGVSCASVVIKDKVFVSVDAKIGILRFGRNAIDAMNMNHSFIKLSYDSNNNVIAWRIRKELDNEKLRELGWKPCAKALSNQCYSAGIGRILETFQDVEKKSYKRLEVKKYQDKTSVMDKDVYYFIEVKDNV